MLCGPGQISVLPQSMQAFINRLKGAWLRHIDVWAHGKLQPSNDVHERTPFDCSQHGMAYAA